MTLKTAWQLIKTAGSNWSDDKASRLGAAIAYYTVFAIPPLLVIVIFVASLVFDENRVRSQLMDQVGGMVGEQGAGSIGSALDKIGSHKSGIIATVIAAATLILTATGLFVELQSSLNTIWGVQAKGGLGVWGFIRDRLLSFAMVLGIGFLLMVSLVVSAVLAALGKYLAGLVPGLDWVWMLVNVGVSIGVITLLFAMIFKVLPDLRIAWRDVWVGALLTAILFTAGKFALGLYLGKNSTVSAYGAAGSLVLILLWVYYSAQILFFGAEFTQAYAARCGTQLVPKPNAQWVECPPEALKAQQRPGTPMARRPPKGKTDRKEQLVEELREQVGALRRAVQQGRYA
jgi:membrane protein